MNRIKVLQLITSLGAGGAERLLLNMMGHFDKERFEVRVATLVDDVKGLTVYNYTPGDTELLNARAGAPVKTIASLASFYRRFAPDVVHAHMFHPLMAGLVLTRHRLDPAPLCFTSHCYEQAFPGLRRPLVKASRKLRAADIIFSADQHPDLNAKRTLVIPNGVEVAPSRFVRRPWQSGAPLRLLTVGRITDQKDPLGLIRTVAAIPRPEVTLDFVGTGPLEASARELVAELRLQDRIRFHGVRADIREVMQNSDIFVMHSKFEGMPMVLLEAGAEAMPVVATPAGSIASILAGDRGRVTTTEHFTDALIDVIDAPEHAIQMGHRLYDYVLANHSIQSTTAKHQDLYAELALAGS
jgi:glycosyltransferase involved in cell wall biosynthesis